MKVSKEVCFVCFFGFFAQAQAIFSPARAPVTVSIDPVPVYVCAGSTLSFGASIGGVEGTAEVTISAGAATAKGSGMGAASAVLSLPACEAAFLVVYFSFSHHESYSSNVVVISIAGVEVVSPVPLCVPAKDPIRYRAYPTDAAGYKLCPPQWTGPKIEVDPQDPWEASAICDQGGYYYAYAALGADPPCRIVVGSVKVMACEVHLYPAYTQDYSQPYIFPNVCINAQPEYGRARYRVEVLPDDTGGRLSLAGGGGDVILSRNRVGNRDTFYVQAGNTPGIYRVRLEHESLPGCDDIAEGVVFEFDSEMVAATSPGPNTSRGVGAFDPVTGTVSASTPDDNPAGHGALLTRGYQVNVKTIPPDVFNGKVRTDLHFVHTLEPQAAIYKNANADFWTLAVSASLGFVRISAMGGGSRSIATAAFKAEVQIGASAAIDAGSFTISSADFSVPLLWITRQFGKPIVQVIDLSQEIPVGGQGLPVRSSIGVLCVRRDGRGEARVESAQARGRLEVRPEENSYEIVP